MTSQCVVFPIVTMQVFKLFDLGSALFTNFNYPQVVQPDQTTKIYRAIKDKGLPVALVEYEGEPHGFRKV